MKKKFPKFTSDNQLEKIIDQDLSDYIHKGNFKKVSLEFQPKEKKVNIRFPEALLDAVKKRAERLSIPYQKFIRLVLEKEVL